MAYKFYVLALAMANQVTPAQQHLFRYQSFLIDKSQPLGHGSYGAVYKAKCDQLPCAAKVLHPTILDPMDPGADKIRDRFSQECALLESIRHPNIVQYLAMTVDPESRLPVLLMELLDESLTKMLERSQQSLAYYIQVDICHDVALAIAYLHSNNIIHRDLSSNNVLIIAGRRAKVTDFGMSKLAGAAPTMTPLTMCPGTLAYMPPEALREPPRYTKKLDCFSEGVIMIQVCTRQWPKLMIQDKERALHNKDMVMERVIQDKDRVIASQEGQLRQLNHKLEEQEQVTAEIQHSLQRQEEQLQQQLSQQARRNPDHKLHPPKEGKVTLNWRDGGKAPFKMSRGAAVVDGGVAYIVNYSGQACSYNLNSKKWNEFPKYPYKNSSLAVVNGQLTAIGGCEDWRKKHTYTNKLLSLHGSWSDVFPPMPTKRRSTTAVTSKEHLIVAGGATGPCTSDSINTVEVMDTKTLVWSTVASLPHPYSCASATICGDHLYMLGGLDDKDKTKSVLTCSLTELLQSSSSVWRRVADVPAYWSTCAAVNGQLLAVGGSDEDDEATAAIHKYDQRTNTWEHISDMPTATFGCLVAVLPTNEMMAVGGRDPLGSFTDRVEIATCSF